MQYLSTSHNYINRDIYEIQVFFVNLKLHLNKQTVSLLERQYFKDSLLLKKGSDNHYGVQTFMDLLAFPFLLLHVTFAIASLEAFFSLFLCCRCFRNGLTKTFIQSFHESIPRTYVTNIGLISLDTLKYVSVRIVSEVVIRDASGTLHASSR